MPSLVTGSSSWEATQANPFSPYEQLVTDSDAITRPKAKRFSVVAIDENAAAACIELSGLQAEQPPNSGSDRDPHRVHFDFPAALPATDDSGCAAPVGNSCGDLNGSSDSATGIGSKLSADAAVTSAEHSSVDASFPLVEIRAKGGVGAAKLRESSSGIGSRGDSDDALATADELANNNGHHRVHYRKLRERTSLPVAASPAAVAAGSDAQPSGVRIDRLAVPAAAAGLASSSPPDNQQYHNSLHAGDTWSYSTPGGGSSSHRNISTLSLTLLLRDQRRKNLAMLARLFASRQKEKDLLDGQLATSQDVSTEPKKRRCHVTPMHVSMGALFCILVALVTTSVVLFAPDRSMYTSQRGFVFDKDSRLLTVIGGGGNSNIVKLQIQTGVNLAGLPYNCSTPDDLQNQRRCWKWSASGATLHVSVADLVQDLTCVEVSWSSVRVEPILRDCVSLDFGGSWYGGASSRVLPWSLTAAATTSGNVGPLLYASGTSVGALAARAWLSNNGAAVSMRGSTPLYFELSPSAFCLSNWYGYEHGGSRLLTYTACLGANASVAHTRVMSELHSSQLRDPAADVAELWTDSVVTVDPVWILPIGRDSAAELVTEVLRHGFSFDSFLAKDNVLTSSELEQTLAAAKAAAGENATFGITVSSLVSARSLTFLDSIDGDTWFENLHGEVPILLRDEDDKACALVNVSSPGGRDVALTRVLEIASNYQISTVMLESASASGGVSIEDYPPASQERILAYTQSFIELGLNISSAVGRNCRPLIDGATAGLAGYVLPASVRRSSLVEIVSHLLAAAVAGDPPVSIGPYESSDVAGISSSNKYVRWMQLAAFTPVMHFGLPPWHFNDSRVVDIARKLMDFRRVEIVPRLRRLFAAYSRDSSPVYRPVWWNDPAASTSSKVMAQFFLDDLLVAPVLDQKSFRLIYFPRGYWLDPNMKLFIGPGVHNYSVTLESIPYFVQKTTGIHEKGIPDAEINSNLWR